MRRRPHSKHRISRDAERLIWLAQGLAESGSRAEDNYWEGELRQFIDKLLSAGQEEPFNQALDRLHDVNGRAYDELADMIEATTESDVVETADGPQQLLFIAVPVLAWSRYAIPARQLGEEVLAALRVHLSAHVFAADARLSLADHLYSPDQLPYGYVQTRRFAETLWREALANRDHHEDPQRLPEAAHYISDVRYLLGAVAVPAGQPIFRWNEPDGGREGALQQWRTQGGANLQALLTGCGFQLLLPDAYFAAWRRADQEGRPYSLQAAVAYLQSTLEVSASSLRAVAAPFYDHSLREWRVGFSLDQSADVVHGMVWPMMGMEDSGSDVAGEIDRALKAAGVGEVLILEQHFPLEYCEDCGAPLYPNAEGEAVHAEMPEQDETGGSMHLH